MTERRLEYIDNIRIFLTGIVVVHHLAITYGAPGGWYYREFEVTELHFIPLIILVLFVAGNQAYFMGFFFLIGGFFSAKSLTEKGYQRFFTQRLIRLGIPILVYVYLISPILRMSYRKIAFDVPLSQENVLSTYQQISFGSELGPMWFIILLLLFSLLLLPFNNILQRFSNALKFPVRKSALTAAIMVGLLTFLVRIFLPIGTVFQPLNLQIPFLIQYVFLFLIGVIGYQGKWHKELNSISFSFWLKFTIAAILCMPVLFIFSGGASGDLSAALGGLTWQSLAYSIWEQFFCLSMIATLLSLFYTKIKHSSPIARELAASSYSTYIIHPLILVILAAAIKDIKYAPLLKISLLAVPALLFCFLAASILRRFPGFKSIL